MNAACSGSSHLSGRKRSASCPKTPLVAVDHVRIGSDLRAGRDELVMQRVSPRGHVSGDDHRSGRLVPDRLLIAGREVAHLLDLWHALVSSMYLA
jgi:hypothetical protein